MRSQPKAAVVFLLPKTRSKARKRVASSQPITALLRYRHSSRHHKDRSRRLKNRLSTKARLYQQSPRQRLSPAATHSAMGKRFKRLERWSLYSERTSTPKNDLTLLPLSSGHSCLPVQLET